MTIDQPLYLLFRMDARSGQLLGVEEIVAFSDDDAVGKALARAGNERIELWCNRHKLIAVSGSDGPNEFMIAR